ncbi:restriction endonuclease subunit S [Bacillus swezeyi]|uniref:Restriction endonuclease subunit S n=1 Tax=Bacillus swezeyi TaxID=1925020 RepID=A0A5M8RJW8_9BACI|nr:restriction endonuclease subunit S [Bacillus swezeyi]KAA6447700.1 restriction endonuclease subunit S [Bacillus swezeyi]TYS34282.1 restriction endonuclease subunit S [Bacillus swezeyi]
MANKRAPEVRFEEFIGDWEQRNLESIYGKIRNAFVGTATPYYVEDGHFYLESNNVKDGQINRNTEVFINDEFYQKQKDNWLHTGDLVMVQSGHVGHTAVIPEELDNTAAHALIMFSNYREKADPYFLNYQFQTHKSKKKLGSITTGNTIKHILASEMKKFLVDIPGYEEQQTIGNFFKLIDDTIALHQQELTTLKQTKQGFLQKMFPKEGESVPEVRFPGFTEEWEERKLGELADFSKGNGYSKSDLTDKGKPIILYGRLYTRYETVIDSVDTFAIEKENSVISKGNEVIIPSSGETSEDISRASAVSRPGIILGGDLNIVHPANDIDPVFLALTISNGKQQKELSRRAQGKSVVHLHNSDLKEVNLLLPKTEEQIKIRDFFKQLDDNIALNQRELDALKETKKAFLQKMFV